MVFFCQTITTNRQIMEQSNSNSIQIYWFLLPLPVSILHIHIYIYIPGSYQDCVWRTSCVDRQRIMDISNVYFIWLAKFHIPSSLLYKTHQIPTLKRFSYCLAAFFAESLETRCQVENEDVVGAAPTGDAPTTSEWSTILLPNRVRLILETLQ